MQEFWNEFGPVISLFVAVALPIMLTIWAVGAWVRSKGDG